MKKKLMRSGTDRYLGGVCGGIAEYTGIDSSIIRIVAIIVALLPGPAFIVYLALWVIMPLRSAPTR
ncbi:PspC domain-containing protein [Gleimia hominis]|uniref:PspC domain-containing protein n=1 Tax=Gleimia hominis TaxID=595468 RepID=UPI0018EE044E|nr:PspC domain-containing protein [Gleimia hominis]WIK64372.1 PspC domain-containing protein [Gleimia hominis]